METTSPLCQCRRTVPNINISISDFPGSCFIRTDQLDGETDWKLKVAVGCTQRLPAVGVCIHYNIVNPFNFLLVLVTDKPTALNECSVITKSIGHQMKLSVL